MNRRRIPLQQRGIAWAHGSGAATAARRAASRRRGFTLLEVIVALAVFALFSVVLGAAYLNVLNAYDIAGRSAVRNDNVRFARAMLLAEPDRDKAERGDDFDASDGVHVKWHATIEPTQTADVFQVTFVCETTDAKATRTAEPVTETFLLLRPTWSQGTDSAKLREKAKERILELKSKRTP